MSNSLGYLSDVAVLDLDQMRWCEVEVQGDTPQPRDKLSCFAADGKACTFQSPSSHLMHIIKYITETNKAIIVG